MRPRLGRRLTVALSVLSIGITGAVASVLATTNASASNNGLSITPAMGWSSWSFVRRTPTEAKIKAQADAMKNSGLAAHGFMYVNVDDFYQKCDSNGFVVDGNGRWAVDSAKFPSGMKALGDYIHNLGLKFGVYVTPGIAQNAVTQNTPIAGTSLHAKDIADTSKTEKNYNCKHMYYINYSKPGAQEFVNSWANLFASWGADYLKIDGVGAQDIPDVQAWDKALRQTGRPINFALSNNLPIANATTWKQLANSWRTQGDVECYCGPGANGSGYPITDWSHINSRFTTAANWQQYAGPGGWNDLDSLEVGNGDQIGLTADQRRSHFTLWAMAGSPLLLGTDLTHLDSTDMAMLTNDRIIAVDQDGVAAKRIVNNGSQQVFSKKEADGSYVVALFNTATSGTATVSVNWSQVGFSGSADVTNLWSGASGGTVANSYSASLRPGETRLIRAVPTTGGGGGGSTVEAEASGNTIAGSTRTSSCSACSGGTKVGFIGNGAGNYVTINGLTPSAAGSRTLTISYLLSGSRSFFVSVNGGADQQVSLTGTSFSTVSTTTITVNLNAGSNTVKFHNDSAYAPDLDKVSVN
jgi:Alpha galactosidase A/Alpha galactosidase C-terminal beta sandwich domain